MSAGIEENIDFGKVCGDTWHKNPQYERLDRYVTVAEALDVLPNTYEIRPAYGQMGEGEIMSQLKKSNFVYWPEKDVVVAENIGNRFNLLDVEDVVKWVEEAILAPYPDIHIESVGTLNGGSIRFINLVCGFMKVIGDESNIEYRMMITDPIGAGSVKVLDHLTRVVCANTHAFAIDEAKKSGEIVNIRHTASVGDNVKIAAFDMTLRKDALRKEKAKLDMLADTGISVHDVDAVLEKVFPAKDKSGDWKSGTKNKNKHLRIKDIFEGGQEGFMKGYDRSAYALFNSITQYLRDEKVKGGKSPEFDNIAGNKAKTKTTALNALVQLI